MFIISVAGIVFNIFVALALGIHSHLGHSHGDGCGGHGHGHGHSHQTHDHEHEHKHGSAHAGAGAACGHDHSHSHKHDHGQKHSSSACNSDSSSHSHGAGVGSEQQQQQQQQQQGAARPDGGIIISVPAAACIGNSHVAECKCFIQQTGAREIEVRCELPVPAAAPASVQRSRPRSSSGGHSHGHGHGHGHSHDNINLRGAVLHVIGDLVQSAGVAIAGALIWAHQDDPRWYVADPICTFLFSVLVLWTTKNIVMDIVAVLMERAPNTVNPAQVGRGPRRGARSAFGRFVPACAACVCGSKALRGSFHSSTPG
jgi:zinc transporter 2